MALRDSRARNLENRIRKVGEAALRAQKQDQIYESPFDPDLSNGACVKQQDSTGDGTATEEVLGQSGSTSTELLCLGNVRLFR